MWCGRTVQGTLKEDVLSATEAARIWGSDGRLGWPDKDRDAEKNEAKKNKKKKQQDCALSRTVCLFFILVRPEMLLRATTPSTVAYHTQFVC